ncbi:multidrug/biocide efflux PACE transporter [Mangrovibacter plantisponsor]|uniref:Putative membrane protein n=1 Tax=Mangrovibacter plantisponsor TaxID=451513 RepID=A0A317PUB1_9ENTR|nr:multidrug/biocide efflux PACE transporter [Mangrovibacter plantisponsor]PWW05817.1 putative membrane protein [Mangrovibacter plantisponsor]
MKKVNAVHRTLPERLLHAICFEGFATVILAPLAAWIMQRELFEMGMLSLLLATAAMLWNIVYNAVFDIFVPHNQTVRTLKIRLIHASGFEGGFLIIGVALAAFFLSTTLLNAFLLEAGFLLFFLPYTLFYNWGYDTLRARFIGLHV